MSQFWQTLVSVAAGGLIALAGQFIMHKRQAKAERSREWMRFQKDTVAGAQEALADMWRCFVVANPNDDPTEGYRARARRKHLLRHEIPDDEARALMKASVHRTRLKDTGLATEILTWMADATKAIDERPVSAEKRKDLLAAYRSLTIRLGASVRDLQDPDVK